LSLFGESAIRDSESSTIRTVLSFHKEETPKMFEQLFERSHALVRHCSPPLADERSRRQAPKLVTQPLFNQQDQAGKAD
jgi:hypothetical protein